MIRSPAPVHRAAIAKAGRSIALAGLIGALSLGGAAHAQTPGPDSRLSPVQAAIELFTRDRPAALQELERLVAQGDPEAPSALAGLLDWPEVGGDEARIVALYEQGVAAGSDNARMGYAQYLLLDQNDAGYNRAITLLRNIGSEPVQAYAAFPWGVAYLFGRGVDQDLDQGFSHIRRAVELIPVNWHAQYLLARSYYEGWGVEPDDRLSYHHMKIAADGGFPAAQWQVGMMLLNGVGVQEDAVRARDYVRRSAEQSHEPGMISMAVMLALGEGGPVDEAEARRWYYRAAQGGSAHALRSLGGMLVNGEGGARELVKGVAYLEMAVRAGDENAIRVWPAIQDLADQNRAAVDAVITEWIERYGEPR